MTIKPTPRFVACRARDLKPGDVLADDTIVIERHQLSEEFTEVRTSAGVRNLPSGVPVASWRTE